MKINKNAFVSSLTSERGGKRESNKDKYKKMLLYKNNGSQRNVYTYYIIMQNEAIDLFLLTYMEHLHI